MNVLYAAHSGLRYLVVLAGLLALVVFLLGQVQKQPFGRFPRVLGTAYAGLVHLQVTLGLTMAALGRWYPALIGHLAMMLLAAVGLQVALSMNKKRPSPGFLLPLVAVAVSLALIAGGVMAIGRGLFQMVPFAPMG
jgi:phosphoglycerol transferase MdoB-like AlkP superfamily enzyme